jgi:DNA-directed RNA polymerase subunit L
MQSVIEAGINAITSNIVVPDAVKGIINMVGGAIKSGSSDEPAATTGKAKKVRTNAKGSSGSSSSSDSETQAEPKKKRAAKKPSDAATETAKLKLKTKQSSAAAAAAAEAVASGEVKLAAHINKHKLPVISNRHVNEDELRFTMENADASIANALRRILLSEIPCIVFRTDIRPDTTENTVFHVNTTRHHNEILKQRLRCIPINVPNTHKVTDFDYKAYRCEVKEKNTSDTTKYVTTKDFKVVEKATGKVDEALTKLMFQPDKRSGDYIEFARLLPRVVDYTEGEELHISIEMQMSTAEQDSAYNVCATCAYGCTPDKMKQDDAWKALSEPEGGAAAAAAATSAADADSERNWRLLSAHRIFKSNSFDFAVETVSLGVYSNGELIRKACDCMKIKCEKFIESIRDADAETPNVVDANVTIPLAYNIILRREGYTLGKALEHVIYSKHYLGDRSLTFCAFKKMHPHDVDSFIQVALQNDAEDNVAQVSAIAIAAARDVISMFEHIKHQFEDEP